MAAGAQPAVRPKSLTISPKLPFLFLVLALHFSFRCCSAQPQDEAVALVKFKSSLADPESALFNWNPATSPCSGERGNWVGVLCYNGYVWGLQLERMNLKGQIDVEALHTLRFMRAVSLMGNNFEGPMPDWTRIGGIKALYLSDNQFSGEMGADAFKGMYSLKKVYIANNKLSGAIPKSLESPQLTELRLENNRLSGRIPKIRSDSLKVLDLANNQLEGPIPATLSKMDPSAFAGNKALCGEPLSTACDSGSKYPIGLFIALIVIGILFLFILFFLLRRRHRANQTPQLGKPMPMPMPVPSPTIPDVEKKHHQPNLPAPVSAPRSPAPPVDPKAGSASAAATAAAAGVILAKKAEQHQPAKLSFVEETRRKFDLQDLMRASAEVLGSGGFGSSYKAVLVDGEALVVKRFKLMNGIAREDFHEHMRKVGRLKHPNVLPLVAYLFRKEEKLLVCDFALNGSLATILHGKHSGSLKWGVRLKILKVVAKGLLYLHQELQNLTLPHGHLKSSNVVLDRDYRPLLMDYALQPLVNTAHVHQVLLAYKSPEFAQTSSVTRKTDVWCLGTLILETLTGRYLPHGAGADVAAWVNGIAGEDVTKVLDKEMTAGATATSWRQMEKMLKVGIWCCKEDADKRWDLEEAVPQIERIQHDG